jgi:hypothetical protein
MNCSSTNGRIDIMAPNTMNQFELYDKIPNDTGASTFHDAMVGNFSENNLSRAFFCKENIQIVQNGIRAGVYNMSNNQYVVGNQNYDTLKIIMRSVFLQSSTNLPNNISQQIQSLNDLVIEYCVKQIFSEAQAYINYKRDVSTMYTPIDRPTQPDYNNKTLELKHWF